MSRGVRFARNVGINLLGQAAVAAANLVLTPFLVRGLGVESYGLYILLHTAASYFLVATLGAGSASAKFVAEFKAAEDGRSLRAVLVYSAIVHVIGTVAVALGVEGTADFIIQRIFNLPSELRSDGRLILRCAAWGTVFAAAGQWAACVLQGLQRFDWQNGLKFLQGAFMPAGAALALAWGLGLAGAALWFVALNALAAALSVAVVAWLWRSLPRRELGPGLSWNRFASCSLSLWFGSLAWLVVFQSDRLFIANALPLAELTLYGVPANLLQRLQVIPAVFSTVLVPMMSELRGAQARETLQRMYLKCTRLLLCVILPLLLFLFALMPQFLTLWLGPEFGADSVWPARLLVLSQLVFMLAFLPSSVAVARERPWYPSVAAWAQAGVSVLAWWWLIPRWRILGAAAGALLAQILPALVYFPLAHRRLLGLGLGRYAEEALFAPLVGAALFLALVFPIHHLATTWIRLAGLTAAGCILYYGSVWLLLAEEDRRQVRDYLRLES